MLGFPMNASDIYFLVTSNVLVLIQAWGLVAARQLIQPIRYVLSYQKIIANSGLQNG